MKNLILSIALVLFGFNLNMQAQEEAQAKAQTSEAAVTIKAYQDELAKQEVGRERLDVIAKFLEGEFKLEPLGASSSLESYRAWAKKELRHAQKIETLKQEDPNGLVLTLTAVLVVFSALITLAIVFSFVGKFMHSNAQKPKKTKTPKTSEPAKAKPSATKAVGQPSQEESIAISMALAQELQGRSGDVIAAIAMALREELESQHDEESYCLTIGQRPTQWNNRTQTMRQYNY